MKCQCPVDPNNCNHSDNMGIGEKNLSSGNDALLVVDLQ